MPLIDRDALKARLCVDTSIGFYAQGADGSEVCFTSREVDRVIDDAPTIDPVRRGEWVLNFDNFTPAKRCSVCGYNKPEVAGESARDPEAYCPSCGAKVGGDDHA